MNGDKWKKHLEQSVVLHRPLRVFIPDESETKKNKCTIDSSACAALCGFIQWKISRALVENGETQRRGSRSGTATMKTFTLWIGQKKVVGEFGVK